MSTLQTLLIIKALFTSIYVLPSHFLQPYYPYMPSKKKPSLFLHHSPLSRWLAFYPQERGGWPTEGIWEVGALIFISSSLHSLIHLTTCLILPSCLITLFLIIILVNVSDFPPKVKIQWFSSGGTSSWIPTYPKDNSFPHLSNPVHPLDLRRYNSTHTPFHNH